MKLKLPVVNHRLNISLQCAGSKCLRSPEGDVRMEGEFLPLDKPQTRKAGQSLESSLR